jgi:lipopolysaccharide biosynthesis regulator YciM
VRRALVASLEGDAERAEALLTRVVQEDSREVEAYLALALLYRQRGELGRAIHLHQNLLLRRDADRETRFHAQLGLAEDFRVGGFLRRAVAAYEQVLAERPDDPVALRALVRLLVDAREPRRALPLARRLASVEGREAGASEAALWVDCAALERADADAPAARRSLKRALRRDPGCARAWLMLGELELESGRPKKALAAWRRVTELDRRAAGLVYPRLAAAHAALGRPGDHESSLRAHLEEQPDDAVARLALARALVARDAADEALRELRQVLDRDPDVLAAHALLGRLLLGAGRAGEAAKAHEELLDVLERQRERLAALWTGGGTDEGDAFA